MSLASLWNHTVRVYRATRTATPLGGVTETWVAQGTAPTRHNGRPDQAWAGTRQDRGAGEEQGKERVWFLAAALDVQARDVLDVTAGPEAPVRVRVLSVTPPTAPLAVHHLEANVEEWEGDLEEDS